MGILYEHSLEEFNSNQTDSPVGTARLDAENLISFILLKRKLCLRTSRLWAFTQRFLGAHLRDGQFFRMPSVSHSVRESVE